MLKRYLSSSIGKKQIVAVTGLAMVVFLIAHLLGNLFIFQGPEAINQYSQTLHELGALLWIARIGLLVSVLLHIIFIVLLVLENRQARKSEYKVAIHSNTRSISTKTMRISALIIVVYIVWHLIDFTFTHASQANAMVNGEYLGLYGLVYNSLLNPLRAIWYIVAMIAVGMHLSHAIQSTAQTFGFYHDQYTPVIKNVSVSLGTIIAVGFSLVPIYIWILHFS